MNSFIPLEILYQKMQEHNRKMNNKNNNPNQLITAKKSKWLIILIFWQWLASSYYRSCHLCCLSRYMLLFIPKLLIHIVSLFDSSKGYFYLLAVACTNWVFFLSWLLGYDIIAYLIHKWKPLKLLSMHKLSFLFG